MSIYCYSVLIFIVIIVYTNGVTRKRFLQGVIVAIVCRETRVKDNLIYVSRLSQDVIQLSCSKFVSFGGLGVITYRTSQNVASFPLVIKLGENITRRSTTVSRCIASFTARALTIGPPEIIIKKKVRHDMLTKKILCR